MNLDREYTIYGPQGLIGTRMNREQLVELIHDFEPTKDTNAVLANIHNKLAHKAGCLTVVVLQPQPHKRAGRSMRRAIIRIQELKWSPADTDTISDPMTIYPATRPAPGNLKR